MYEALKQLGQNFLENPKYINTMVDSLALERGDIVIEIGPGLGALTQVLGDRSHQLDLHVFAVEIDSRFITKLNTMFVNNPHIEIVERDVLHFLPAFESAKPFKVLGSLPFYITSPILHHVIKMKKQPSRCVFLVQKEVAQKVTNQSPDASYLSTFIQTFYTAEYICDVPRTQFVPQPGVDGAMLVLVKTPHTYTEEFISRYEEFLHRGFRFPRKMLRHSFPSDLLQSAGIEPTLRPEAVSTNKWLDLYAKSIG